MCSISVNCAPCPAFPGAVGWESAGTAAKARFGSACRIHQGTPRSGQPAGWLTRARVANNGHIMVFRGHLSFQLPIWRSNRLIGPADALCGAHKPSIAGFWPPAESGRRSKSYSSLVQRLATFLEIGPEKTLKAAGLVWRHRCARSPIRGLSGQNLGKGGAAQGRLSTVEAVLVGLRFQLKTGCTIFS